MEGGDSSDSGVTGTRNDDAADASDAADGYGEKGSVAGSCISILSMKQVSSASITLSLKSINLNLALGAWSLLTNAEHEGLNTAGIGSPRASLRNRREAERRRDETRRDERVNTAHVM